MKFAIRDDDTSYFTSPEDLEACYAGIWDDCPVSLSCVPFHACTKSGGVPAEYWEGDRVFPLGDNAQLTRYLRDLIRRGRAAISLHGYSHKDLPGGYEFVATSDMSRKVEEGRRYLESLLRTRVTVFVPPHNALSREGWEAVVANGMSICGGSFGQRGIRPRDLLPLTRKKLWEKTHGALYPWPLRYATHKEFMFASVTPTADIAMLRRTFELARRHEGLFCLATHYWEFSERNVMAANLTVGDIVREFFERAAAMRGQVAFTSLSALAAGG